MHFPWIHGHLCGKPKHVFFFSFFYVRNGFGCNPRGYATASGPYEISLQTQITAFSFLQKYSQNHVTRCSRRTAQRGSCHSCFAPEGFPVRTSVRGPATLYFFVLFLRDFQPPQNLGHVHILLAHELQVFLKEDNLLQRHGYLLRMVQN